LFDELGARVSRSGEIGSCEFTGEVPRTGFSATWRMVEFTAKVTRLLRCAVETLLLLSYLRALNNITSSERSSEGMTKMKGFSVRAYFVAIVQSV